MAKDDLARFGVSLSRSLLKELDGMILKKGYQNRSQALRRRSVRVTVTARF